MIIAFIRLTVLFCVFASLAVVHAKSGPNLIVIMTDDQGYNDVGFNGLTEFGTPNIDRIAEQGVVFTDAHVTYAVCGPSRAGFMSGRYPQRHGFERNPAWLPLDPNCGLSREETTIAEALSPVGYHCGIIGKWHLGSHDELHPLSRGFDEFFGHLGGGHQYFPEQLTIKETRQARHEPDSYRTWIMRDWEPVKIDKYLTDEFSDEAVNFIERNRDEPFFLFLAYNAPHAPLQATDEYLSRVGHIENEQRQTYAAMLTAVDDGVGRVLDALEANGLAENTLVFFLSDNGGTKRNASNNTPLRAHKGSAYEGGWRVPFAAMWPGHIPAGEVFNGQVSSMDIYATIASLNEVAIINDRPLDGVNLIPYLTAEKAGEPHDQIYLRNFNRGAIALHSGDYKLLREKSDSPVELYNMKDDLDETTDLASQEPGRVTAMKASWDAWNANLIEPTFQGLNMQTWRDYGKEQRAKQAGNDSK